MLLEVSQYGYSLIVVLDILCDFKIHKKNVCYYFR